MFRRFVLLGSLVLVGCSTAEGVRCNQLAYTSECASGLSCIVPDNCPALVAYCCPTDRPPTIANCNACPPPDGGTD